MDNANIVMSKIVSSALFTIATNAMSVKLAMFSITLLNHLVTLPIIKVCHVLPKLVPVLFTKSIKMVTAFLVKRKIVYSVQSMNQSSAMYAKVVLS